MRKFEPSRRIENPFDQLNSGMLYMARAVIAPVAAKFSALQVQNPANSQHQVVVHKIRGLLATAGRVQFSLHAALITTVVTPTPLRPATPTAASALARSDTLAAVDTVLMESDAALTMSDLTPFSPLFWLSPGVGIAVEAETANIGATFEIYWSELWC